MTMLLGFNLGIKSFLSADTRVSENGNPKADDVQKIEILKNKGLIVAAAGNRAIAANIVNAIKSGVVELPILYSGLPGKINRIIQDYINKEYSKGKPVPNNLLDNKVIVIIQSRNNSTVKMDCFEFGFMKNGRKKLTINKKQIKEEYYIKVGAEVPISISKIPNKSKEILKSWENTALEDYLEATNEIFKVALLNANAYRRIGGKTITLQTFVGRDGVMKYKGIRGFRSLIHIPEEWQDVSVVTEFDSETGRFFFRDMRSEGMIVSNIDYSKDRPMLRYDSCPKKFGRKDVFLRRFSSNRCFREAKLEL